MCRADFLGVFDVQSYSVWSALISRDQYQPAISYALLVNPQHVAPRLHDPSHQRHHQHQADLANSSLFVANIKKTVCPSSIDFDMTLTQNVRAMLSMLVDLFVNAVLAFSTEHGVSILFMALIHEGIYVGTKQYCMLIIRSF